MPYKNLHSLIQKSRSSRSYFLSLPVPLQMQLHQQNDFIHTADDLHRQTEYIQRYNHQVEVSRMLF
ncbi:hypothetical protein BN3661_00061 [Eubacteriaceae bacterium CHKCI005]|uniref:Uncharacterized protein n=1 Tax=Solibaculum mannosilyticum TaxID=2780922 RepID=A0A7I8D4C0_9FIRM|nr:hypothetical protein C12CBH8_09880 [Solibaculum mannosilyticum]CZT54990.1 hypothetical protein BN3661_00061 [Eubacteriaceae bacterium CHKCI005]